MEQKHNYQKDLDALIAELDKAQGPVPRLLLHSCCAPCSSYVLEYLSDHFEITDQFYNPNIYPEQEFRYRSDELKRLIEEMDFKHPVGFIEEPYDSGAFYGAVKGLEDIPEGGERCFACYELRMRKAAEKAKEGGYDYFTTTLSISPLKNAQKINEIGQKLEAEYGVRHLPSDFKKKNGYKRSTELSAQYGLYRQDYCGCVFSRQERALQKAEAKKQSYIKEEK